MTEPLPTATVRVGVGQTNPEAGLYLALEKGYFQEQGLAVETVVAPNASLADMVPQLATGGLDVGQGGILPALFNAFLRDTGIRVVAAAAVVEPGRSTAFLVRKALFEAGDVREYAALRGKTLAGSPSLSITYIAYMTALERGGLQPGDVRIVPLTFPDTVPALANGAIDAALLVEPFAAAAVERGAAVRWREMADLLPHWPLTLWVYSPRLVYDQPDVGRRFMIALLRGVRAYEDAVTKRVGWVEAVTALTKHTAIKDPALYDKMTLLKLPTSGELQLDRLQQALDWFIQAGAVPQPPDLSQLIVTEFTDYASRLLGPYR